MKLGQMKAFKCDPRYVLKREYARGDYNQTSKGNLIHYTVYFKGEFIGADKTKSGAAIIYIAHADNLEAESCD